MLLSLHIPFQDDPKTCHSITIFNSLLFSRWGTHPLRTMSLWWPWSVLRKRVTNWPNFTTTNTWTQRENGRQILITRPLADRTKWRSLNTAKRSVFWLLLFWSKCAHDSNLDFRDKAKTKCTKLKIFFEKQEFLEWELYSDQQGKKRIIEAKNRNQRMRTRSLSTCRFSNTFCAISILLLLRLRWFFTIFLLSFPFNIILLA